MGSQLSPSSINLVPAQAGKVTVGLAWHWPHVTDTVVYPPTGSMAKDREMSTHAYDPSGCGTIYLKYSDGGGSDSSNSNIASVSAGICTNTSTMYCHCQSQ